MKLQYLGTAAAEGVPALFCTCDNCRRSREAGGRHIRTRSQAIIDDRLLIDFPADTYMHYLTYHFPLPTIKDCLVTHAHSDHLYPAEIHMREKWFASLPADTPPLTFHGDVAVCDAINRIKAEVGMQDDRVVARQIPLFTPFEVDGYTVTALRATHDPQSSPVVYLISNGDKTLFYSNDTGEYPAESMAYLENLPRPLDLISLDCTSACSHSTYPNHFSLERCETVRQQLLDCGAADAHTQFVLNHFSHDGEGVVYDDFVPVAAAKGFQVAYDGMVIAV